jgi:hypothetical protein
MNDIEYIHSDEAMAILKISSATLTRIIKRGHLPGTRKLDPTRKNSKLLIPRPSVEAFLAAQDISPKKEKQEQL